MKKSLELNRIPADPEKFFNFINATDDCQAAIDTAGFTIYPLDENGKRNYRDKANQKVIINEPFYLRWDWTPEESLQWTSFRNGYNELHQKYLSGSDDEKIKLENQLHTFIAQCCEFDKEHKLIQRVASGWYTTKPQMALFNIRQDVVTYKTTLRTITFNYEKALPLNKLENLYVEKYTVLHEQTTEIRQRIKKLRNGIKEELGSIPALWEQIPVVKDKADKATNSVFINMSPIKGAFSEPQSFYIPTAEENRQNTNDFNEHNQAFYNEMLALKNRCDALLAELNSIQNIFEGEEGEEEVFTLFNETDELRAKLFEDLSYSLDVMSVDGDNQDFLESWSVMNKEYKGASDDWANFIREETLLVNVYNNLAAFLKSRFEGDDDELAAINADTINPGEEGDDPGTETIGRYEADLKLDTNTYFDIADWLIILDHYQRKFDLKNKALALERAMTQHPGNTSLLITKAGDLSADHQYREALEMIKQAEEQGPPHHPNLYYVKASVYCRLQTPELAIPIYEKLLKQEGNELKWWRINSYHNLVEIYEKKKDYDRCITLYEGLITEEPDDENHCSNLARFYILAGKPGAGELPLKNFLEKHPQSSACHQRLGHVYTEMKEFNKAIECYNSAFKLDKGDYYEAIFFKGKALMEMKRYEEAAPCFELCLLYFKPGKDYHLNAALCYEKLNMMHQAQYHYRKVQALETTLNG